MSGWQTLWTWALGLSVVLFFVVEVVVVVGGAGDIKDMLASLRKHAAEDAKDPATALDTTTNRNKVVTNLDLAIDSLHALMCGVGTAKAQAWYDLLFPYIVSGDNGASQTALEAAGFTTQFAVLVAAASDTLYAAVTANTWTAATPIATVIAGVTNWTALMAAVPNVANIEDEADFKFVRDIVNCKMDAIRADQIENDREQQMLEYTNEASECNQAYHEEVFGELTFIDECELTKRYQVGKELLTDLDGMYKENAVTKQSFFKDSTLTGGCSW
jgi:hypothetical protein